jgi:hypothetical protein
MANLQGFDANTVEPSVALEAVPAGKYLAMIVDSAMKPNKAGNGQFLELVFQILEGECKGRQLWARLNLVNPNELATKIAQGELSAICRAVGVMTPGDSVELHNLPLVIKVKLKKRADTGEFSNEVKGYEKREAAGGKPQQAVSNTPPWRRP